MKQILYYIKNFDKILQPKLTIIEMYLGPHMLFSYIV